MTVKCSEPNCKLDAFPLASNYVDDGQPRCVRCAHTAWSRIDNARREAEAAAEELARLAAELDAEETLRVAAETEAAHIAADTVDLEEEEDPEDDEDPEDAVDGEP